jgi:hypothetical protein
VSAPLFFALSFVLVGSILAIVAIGASLDYQPQDPRPEREPRPADERDNLLPNVASTEESVAS